MKRHTLLFAIAASLATAHAAPAPAQTYPARPIRVLVPYAPGGAVDFVARTIGQKLGEAWSQSVLVDNRAGGATNIGSELAAKAASDGYTLLMGTAANAVNVSLYPKLAYDVRRDFVPVVLVGTSANVLVVHPSLPVQSAKALIALAKAKPGELTYASAGTASSNHLSGELFQLMTGVKLVHVPYRGGGPAITDLLGGQVTMYFSSLPSALPLVKTGKLRALGVTSAKRSAAAPDLPTIAETVAGYTLVAWHAVLAPAGTPQDIVQRLNTEINRIVHVPETRARLEAQGVEVVGGTSGEFGRFLNDEIAKYAKLVKSASLTAD
ncbi:MAG: tripartite tricarboxylate transporter substrate binding protein [Rhodospirillaceae bacterium]